MPAASPAASGSSLIPIPEPRGGGASGRSAAGCKGLLRQRSAQLPATRHAELVVDVAEGRSNPEIAQILFVTRKTVETHLGHVYHKLGVPGRGQLGRALAEQTPTASG